MKLENQVCSLELAKELKELGAEQDSLFYWWMDEIKIFKSFEFPPSGKEIHFTDGTWTNSLTNVFSDYTVAELGEMLPSNLQYGSNFYLTFRKLACKKNMFTVGHMTDEDWKTHTEADTEADARAKMLIYLKTNNLIKA